LHGRDADWQKTSTSPKLERLFLKEVRYLYAARERYLPADFVDLQLHDMQFNLCEFGKYRRVESGEGKLKRRYAR
jgi:hypothetical protein